MAETVYDIVQRAVPVSGILSDTGESEQKFDEVYQTAAAVPDKPTLGQERQDRFSGWRGLPRRAIRALHRCRAMFRMPEELGRLNRTVNVALAGVEYQLRSFVGEQRAASSDLQRELSTEMAFSLHDIAQRLVDQYDGTRIEQQLRSFVGEQRAALAEALRAEVTRLHEQLRRTAEASRTEIAGIHEQLRRTAEASRIEIAGIHEQLRCIAENQTRLVPEAFSDLQRALSTEMAFSLHDIAQRMIGQHSDIRIEQQLGEQAAKLKGIGNHLNRLANEQFEAKNHLTHVGTNTESQLQNLITITGELRNTAIHLDSNVQSRLNTIEYERLDGLYEQMHHVTAGLLRLRADVEKDRSERPRLPAECYAPAQSHALEADLQRAQAEFPQVFTMWAERLEEMRQACLETKTGNVAHTGDPRSEAFRSLVELHAVGRVLDVGCGIFGRPFYLSSCPASLISGLDPLEPREPVDFEFVRGIQEYLPWPDGAFSTVISATALDHCLSLDRSLAEIRRVLCAGGRFLLWIDSHPGSSRFAPNASDFVPADRFHLFHFDAAWLEPMLDRWFKLIDKVELRGREFDRVMYCLRLRDLDSAKRQ